MHVYSAFAHGTLYTGDAPHCGHEDWRVGNNFVIILQPISNKFNSSY